MESQPNISKTVSHPKDRSLAAYKDWVMEIATRLTTEGTEIKLTEEEWIASWQDYWKEKSGN